MKAKLPFLLAFVGFIPNATQDYVTPNCTRCICKVLSDCDTSITCDENSRSCGPFRITKGFWLDANSPTVGKPDILEDTNYRACSLDMNCANLAIQNYMNKFEKDCNGDGKIDCDDYIRIHLLGPFNCGGKFPNPKHQDKYQQCKEDAVREYQKNTKNIDLDASLKAQDANKNTPMRL